MPGPVVLLTDFGLSDPYVGQMKGALLSQAPGAAFVDLCHVVEPFNLVQSGFFLEASRAFFPAGTIFVSVVDPGVGGERRIVLLEKHRQFFLAPDNGLLSFVLGNPGPVRAWNATPPWRRDVSATFHGRDIFAPLAARLATGQPPQDLGQEINPHTLELLPDAEPTRSGQRLESVVLHVDRFGNCILNLKIDAWAVHLFKSRQPTLLAPTETPVIPTVTYEKLQPGELGLIKGSQGYLELAMNQESAAALLGLKPGSQVVFGLDQA